MPGEYVSTPSRPRTQSMAKDPHSAPAHTRQGRARRPLTGLDGSQDEDFSRPHTLKAESLLGDSPKAKLSRIKFRIKPASLPLIHPGQVFTRPPKQYPSLREFLKSASSLPIEAGGLVTGPEDLPEYTPEGIVRDAHTILHIEAASSSGGVLSQARCSLYQPEEQDRPPQQYSHQDHLIRAAIGFQKLMVNEHKRHRITAKRLADACRDEWYRRQPKTKEQLEAEQAKAAQTRYRTVLKSLQGAWENVRIEVNRRRLVEWEAQEQARVRKALNEAVDLSTQKLQARRTYLDSEETTDDEGSD